MRKKNSKNTQNGRLRETYLIDDIQITTNHKPKNHINCTFISINAATVKFDVAYSHGKDHKVN